jgi:hypothetical protein
MSPLTTGIARDVGEDTMRLIFWARAALGWALCLSASACALWEDPPSDVAYLHVSLANQQPRSPDLGVVLNIQGQGGDYVSLFVQAGTLRAQSTGSALPVTGACLHLTEHAAQVVVIPVDNEASLFASLYSFTSPPDAGPDGSCASPGTPIRSTVTPISFVTANTGGGPDAGGGN